MPQKPTPIMEGSSSGVELAILELMSQVWVGGHVERQEGESRSGGKEKEGAAAG